MLTLLSHPAEESQERAGASSNNIPHVSYGASNAGPGPGVSQAGARRSEGEMSPEAVIRTAECT